MLLSLFDIIGNQATPIDPCMKALEFCKQHCNLRRCHSIRQRPTIGSLEKNSVVYFSNNYVLYFGIVIFILDGNSCTSPSRCFLLLLNAHYCCIIKITQLRMGEVLVSLYSITGILHSSIALLGASKIAIPHFFQCTHVHFCKDGEPDWFTVSQIYSIPRGTINILDVQNHWPTMSKML